MGKTKRTKAQRKLAFILEYRRADFERSVRNREWKLVARWGNLCAIRKV